MRAKLIVVQGRATRHEIPIKRFPLSIGRADDCSLTVLHDTVSRHHCELFEQGGQLVVRDRGSTNGTLVDGQPVSEAVLAPGAKLTVGPLVFEVAYELAATAQSASSSPPAQIDESFANALLAPDPMLDEMAAGALFDDVADEADQAEADAGTAQLETAQLETAQPETAEPAVHKPPDAEPGDAEPGDLAPEDLEPGALAPGDEPAPLDESAALDTAASSEAPLASAPLDSVPLDEARTDDADLDELAFDVLDDEPLPLPDGDDAHSSAPSGRGEPEETPVSGEVDDSPPQSSAQSANPAAPAAAATSPLADRASDELEGLDDLNFLLEETPLDDAYAPEPLLGAAPASELIDDQPSEGDQLPEPIEAAGFDVLDDELPALEAGADDAGLEDVPLAEPQRAEPRADHTAERPDDTGWIDAEWNALDDEAARDDEGALDDAGRDESAALDDAAPSLPADDQRADDQQPADDHIAADDAVAVAPAADESHTAQPELAQPPVARPADDSATPIESLLPSGPADDELGFLESATPPGQPDELAGLSPLTDDSDSIDLFELASEQQSALVPATTDSPDEPPLETIPAKDSPVAETPGDAVGGVADDAIDEIALEPLAEIDESATDRPPAESADADLAPLAAAPNVVESEALVSDASAQSDEGADDSGLFSLPVALEIDADDASDELAADVDLDLFTPLDDSATDVASTADEPAASESPDEPPLEAFALDEPAAAAPTSETPSADVPLAAAPAGDVPSAEQPSPDMPSVAEPAAEADAAGSAVAWPSLNAADGVMELSPWENEASADQEPVSDEAAPEEPALEDVVQTEPPIALEDVDQLDEPVALDEIASSDEHLPSDRAAADDAQGEPDFDLDDALDLDFDESPAETAVPRDEGRDDTPLGQDDEDSLVFDFPPEEMAEDEEAAEAVALEFDELPLEVDDSNVPAPAVDAAAAGEDLELAFEDVEGKQVAADEASVAADADTPAARRRWWWPFTPTRKPRRSRAGRQKAAAAAELDTEEQPNETPLAAEPAELESDELEPVAVDAVAVDANEAPASAESASPAKAPAKAKRRFWSLSLGWPLKRKAKSVAARAEPATRAEDGPRGDAAAEVGTTAPLPVDDLEAESFEPLEFDLDSPAPDAASPLAWSPEASESSSSAAPHRRKTQDSRAQDGGLADEHRAVEPPPADADVMGDAEELAFDALDDDEPQLDLPSHDASGVAGNGQPAASDDDLAESIDFDEPTPSAPVKRRSSGLSEDDLDDLLNSND